MSLYHAVNINYTLVLKFSRKGGFERKKTRERNIILFLKAKFSKKKRKRFGRRILFNRNLCIFCMLMMTLVSWKFRR
jgi:hypothetical protein